MKSHFDNIEKVRAQQKILKWLGAKFERNQSSTTSLTPQSYHPAHRGALRWTHRQISISLWNNGNEPIWGNQRSLELPTRASSQKVHVSVAQGNWAYASQWHFSQRHKTVSKRFKSHSTIFGRENILLGNETIKLADLGSCRGLYNKPPLTEYISTRWYRAPECLMTDGHYGYKMDIWGVGCVFFEVLSLYPLFPGENELDQIHKIHNIMGTPP